MNNVYVLSAEQIDLLLNIGGFYGLNEKKDNLIFEDKDKVYLLHQLEKKGYITSDGEKFTINNSDIQEIVTSIAKAKDVNGIFCKNIYLGDLFAYCGEKTLVLSIKKEGEKLLSCYFSEADELFEDLYEQGYLPEEPEDPLFIESEVENFENAYLQNMQVISPIDEESPVLFRLNTGCNTSCKKCMMIVEYYFFNYILLFDGKEKTRFLYEKSKAKELFVQLMENKYDC